MLSSEVGVHLELTAYPGLPLGVAIVWGFAVGGVELSLNNLEKEMATHSSILAWRIP